MAAGQQEKGAKREGEGKERNGDRARGEEEEEV